MVEKLGCVKQRKKRAEKLLQRIETYLRTHELSPSIIGTRAGLHCNFVRDMRDGVVPVNRSMDMLDAFLDAHPDGLDYKPRLGTPGNAISYAQVLEMSRAKESPSAFVVNRDPCFKCGVRRDFGCKHFPASKPIPLRDAV